MQPLDCQPLYEPTFDNVFSRTLIPSCGIAGQSCHGADGVQGGVVFDDIDDAHSLLVSTTERGPYVIPSDPACSPLVERLETDDPARQMPPGPKLSPEELCAVELWLRQGAQR